MLEAGRRIAQLIFIAMEGKPEVAYGEAGSTSHYQGQRSTPARPRLTAAGAAATPARSRPV